MKRHTLIVAIALTVFLTGAGAAAPARAEQDRVRQFETQHYRVWTDVEHDLATDLCRRMDAMYDEYARRFASFAADVPAGEKFDVRVFARREDFVRYTRDRLPNAAGVFMPNRRLLAAFVEGAGRDGVRQTLQHEAFHQFAHEAIGPNVPLWLNEGIAQVFEESIWTGQGFVVGQVPPRRVRQLQQDVAQGKLIDFRKLLRMSHKEWASNFADREMMTVQYNQAWAMAHFLIYATGPDGEPLYRARVIDLLRRCKQGAAPHEAFVGAFSENIDGFQQRFTAYARTLAATREATCIDNQTTLADLLVRLKERGRTFDSIDAFRDHLRRNKVRLHYKKGALTWATAADPGAYFNDPEGRPLNSRQLFFEPHTYSPMPDLVSRALEGVQIRTRFYESAGKIEHETLVEPRPTHP